VYGLAGLRVGYAIGPAAIIHEIEKSRGPYKVGRVAEAAAIRALADGSWVAEVVRDTKANRARLAAVLTKHGIHAMQSFGNFLLIRLPESFTAAGTNAALRTHGVAVRPFPQIPHAGECIRVTIGPWPMMERFVDALTSVLAGEPA
jgi:histidinol-phosphate/aromatic aminotransferase/cobyric acid decarboxylase-like protein